MPKDRQTSVTLRIVHVSHTRCGSAKSGCGAPPLPYSRRFDPKHGGIRARPRSLLRSIETFMNLTLELPRVRDALRLQRSTVLKEDGVGCVTPPRSRGFIPRKTQPQSALNGACGRTRNNAGTTRVVLALVSILYFCCHFVLAVTAFWSRRSRVFFVAVYESSFDRSFLLPEAAAGSSPNLKGHQFIGAATRLKMGSICLPWLLCSCLISPKCAGSMVNIVCT